LDIKGGECDRVNTGEEQFEQVNSFKYLGSMVNTDNSIEEEIKERIAAGNRAYRVHRNRAYRVHKIGHTLFAEVGHTAFIKIGRIVFTEIGHSVFTKIGHTVFTKVWHTMFIKNYFHQN